MNRFVCHCLVSAYDGVSTITARPTEVVEAESEQGAMKKVKNQIETRYEKNACTVILVTISSMKKVG